MFVQVNIRFMVLVFAFCQVMGAMCSVPDLSWADDMPQMAGELSHAACPMDGTVMCPPSLTTSPERQIKTSMVVVADPVLSLVSRAEIPAAVSLEMSESWSSAYSLVPLSISSSSVLRI